MLPWIMLGASLLQNSRKKEDMRKQALEELMMNHARSLGADTSPLQAMSQRRAIDDVPMVDPGMLANAIGSTVESQSIDERLSKEMAKRGLMKGYQPFDQESSDPQGDMAAAVRSQTSEADEIAERQRERQGILSGMNYGGYGGYYGGGR